VLDCVRRYFDENFSNHPDSVTLEQVAFVLSNEETNTKALCKSWWGPKEIPGNRSLSQGHYRILQLLLQQLPLLWHTSTEQACTQIPDDPPRNRWQSTNHKRTRYKNRSASIGRRPFLHKRDARWHHKCHSIPWFNHYVELRGKIFDEYRYWKALGADRYLMRHETADEELYENSTQVTN